MDVLVSDHTSRYMFGSPVRRTTPALSQVVANPKDVLLFHRRREKRGKLESFLLHGPDILHAPMAKSEFVTLPKQLQTQR